MMPFSDSNTAATCLREISASSLSCAKTSDFVGAPPFFAIYTAPSRRDDAECVAHGAQSYSPDNSFQPRNTQNIDDRRLADPVANSDTLADPCRIPRCDTLW